MVWSFLGGEHSHYYAGPPANILGKRSTPLLSVHFNQLIVRLTSED